MDLLNIKRENKNNELEFLGLNKNNEFELDILFTQFWGKYDNTMWKLCSVW